MNKTEAETKIIEQAKEGKTNYFEMLCQKAWENYIENHITGCSVAESFKRSSQVMLYREELNKVFNEYQL
jgi:hypothetical protein